LLKLDVGVVAGVELAQAAAMRGRGHARFKPGIDDGAVGVERQAMQAREGSAATHLDRLDAPPLPHTPE
jgi:hypothetical protein